MKVWRGFTEYFLYIFPGTTVVMTWDFSWRDRQIYWIFLFTMTTAIMNFTKIAYHEPRPYWDNSLLFEEECSAGYGNPSGHSMMAATFAVAVILETFESAKGKTVSRVVICVLVGLLMTAYFILLGWSRLIVGVHSLNQVLYGWILGIWLALACHFCVREPITERARGFLKNTQTATTKEIVVVVIL